MGNTSPFCTEILSSSESENPFLARYRRPASGEAGITHRTTNLSTNRPRNCTRVLSEFASPHTLGTMPTDINHAAVFEVLEAVAEDADPARLHLTIDDITDNADREVTATVVEGHIDRRDPESATVDLSVEFDTGIEVELPDTLDEDTAMSNIGFLYQEQTERDTYDPAELRLTSAARTVDDPLVGDVREVERVD